MNHARVVALCSLLLFATSFTAAAQESLFYSIGAPDGVDLPDHAVAAQNVRINRSALQAESLVIDAFGEKYVATRTHVDRQRAGQVIWTGHLAGSPGDAVIIVLKGNTASGFIQRGFETYRIGAGPGDYNRLLMLDLRSLPADDAGKLPDGGGARLVAPREAVTGNTVQDLLVVYNQAACTSANSSGDCAQLEADIVTAVADINAAYSASGINITMNLVGTHKTVYTGTDASQALADVRGTSDGQMDEIHAIRDALGADIVSLVYDGAGCGIGYLNSSASSAFNVTDEPCLVGNRTMAHEIGHNQGAHHDRQTAGAGSSTSYNYGYRRCNDGSVDDFGAPFFRTVLSYSCASAPRVGRFSNPNVNYSGVPQGVDPAIEPTRGAYNAQVLNDRAAVVAGFRASAATEPPAAPTNLSALAEGPDLISLAWQDNSGNETSFIVQHSTDGSSWSDLADVAANLTVYSHDSLVPESLHFYRVRAENSAGASGYSNVASETTLPQPATVEDLANGEVPITGTVSGSYLDTHAVGGPVETITERHSGGPPPQRTQFYEHAWTFDVFGGAGGVVVNVVAWVSGSEGANFYYSLDGGDSRNLMFSVNNNAPSGPQSFTLPAGTSGPVRIEVQDATQSAGEPVDTLTVDHLSIVSHTEAGSPPATPSGLSVTGTTSSSVSMEFTDNSEDEFGFEIWRSTADPSGDCEAGTMVDTLGANSGTGLVAYTDTSAAASSTYWYWTRSYNGSGNNGSCSNADSGTTAGQSEIDLYLHAYKIRGIKHVDLTWFGATGENLDVYRNGSLLLTTPNDGDHMDNTGQKGGGSFTYEVCETAGGRCSEAAVADF